MPAGTSFGPAGYLGPEVHVGHLPGGVPGTAAQLRLNDFDAHHVGNLNNLSFTSTSSPLTGVTSWRAVRAMRREREKCAVGLCWDKQSVLLQLSRNLIWRGLQLFTKLWRISVCTACIAKMLVQFQQCYRLILG